MSDLCERTDFAPCPLCKQYSHSIGDGAVTKAFLHFQSMLAHPLRGPMGDAFDEQTRDAAQVLTAHIARLTSDAEDAIAVFRRTHDDIVLGAEREDTLTNINAAIRRLRATLEALRPSTEGDK